MIVLTVNATVREADRVGIVYGAFRQRASSDTVIKREAVEAVIRSIVIAEARRILSS